MSIVLYNLFLRLLLATHLLFPGITALVTGGEYGETQREYSQSMDERERLMGELGRLEGEYQKFVADIEKLKREGQGVRSRRDLEGLLRQSRQISDELEGLQGRIRQVDGRMENQRTRILGALDKRIQELEISVASVPASERAEIVSQLNALRIERRKYATPMPPLPDHRRVMETLQMASALDSSHPAELLAAADELEDTEDQVRARLRAIEDRLGELQQARRLSRRAQSFSREESFFEEGDRSRLIARFDRGGARTEAGGDEANSGDADMEAGNNMVGDDEPALGAAPEADFSDDAPAPSAGYEDGARDSEPDPTFGAPGTSEPPPPDNTLPESNRTPVRETVVFESSVDPSRSVDNVYFNDGNLDRNIRSLEEERKRLERQAGELRHKADGLTKSAGDALD
ncbi:MAG: hypothetical protein ACNA8W_20200 [Bradymonadaceae bacterium]